MDFVTATHLPYTHCHDRCSTHWIHSWLSPGLSGALEARRQPSLQEHLTLSLA